MKIIIINDQGSVVDQILNLEEQEAILELEDRYPDAIELRGNEDQLIVQVLH